MSISMNEKNIYINNCSENAPAKIFATSQIGTGYLIFHTVNHMTDANRIETATRNAEMSKAICIELLRKTKTPDNSIELSCVYLSVYWHDVAAQ